MAACENCGNTEFESHEGYLYCTECQIQSQEYHEQEFDYFEKTVVRHKKIPKKKTPTNIFDDGQWTSWEAFNFILYGMTKELEKCCAPEGFRSLVLKFWAFYLKASNACFTSTLKENAPQLKLNFKPRDARVLYNINTGLFKSKRRRKKRVSVSSFKSSNTSNSSFSEESRHAIARKKRKVIASDYEELLSTSMQSRSSLQDETLESLGSSSITASILHESSEEDEIMKLKNALSKKDFRTFKKIRTSNDLQLNAKNCTKRNIKSLAKNKLLSIIHLSLLLLNSEIQLSDLLRFIREGHLSYAKVTHFLPHYIKFSQKDFCYIDVVSDNQMPTHLSQRKITSQLACLLKIERIPTPDMTLLIHRYCYDLNLPEQLENFSNIIVNKWVPKYIIPKVNISLPSYEAWAMVSIIFVMKLLFGLNDKTEIFLSDLASDLNSSGSVKEKLFEFKNWQKFMECRKTVLTEHHYPTQEQLEDDVFTDSKKFIHTIMRESKDDVKSERFNPYKKYYMDQNLVKSIKDMLNVILTPMNFDFFLEFPPSLTPQTSHLSTIMDNLNEKFSKSDCEKIKCVEEILQKNFRDCLVDFTFNLDKCLDLLKNKNCSLSQRFSSALRFCDDKRQSYSTVSDSEMFLNCSSKYWCLHYTDTEHSFLSNFKEAVFEDMPKNFQWLITECSRMLEMNVRDVYNELIKLELVLMPESSFSCKKKK